MGRKLISGLNIFAVVCLCLFVFAACAKKQVSVPSAPVSGTMDTEQEMGDTMTPPEGEMEDAAIREARLDDMKDKDMADSIAKKKIYFDYDRSDLSAAARATLKEVAEMMDSYPSWTLDISGHCDERGTIEYNLALGEHRAEAIKKYLVDKGISPDRIKTISFGEEKPAYDNTAEKTRKKNRRVYIPKNK